MDHTKQFEQWYAEALRLIAEFSRRKGALDIAHVLGDARLYLNESPGEEEAWQAIKRHLRALP